MILHGFYTKSEIDFLGQQINFAMMTPAQLDETLVTSINLYNKLYPPPPKKGKFMNKVITIGIIAGVGVMTGGALLAAYGLPATTAAAAASSTASALSLPSISLPSLASIQTAASYVSGAGIVYGKVTGDTPKALMQAADLIQSDSALNAMEKVAKHELNKKGMEIQADDEASNAALRERLRKEQQQLAQKLEQAANKKALAMGNEPPQKKALPVMQIAALATPFILFALR